MLSDTCTHNLILVSDVLHIGPIENTATALAHTHHYQASSVCDGAKYCGHIVSQICQISILIYYIK